MDDLERAVRALCRHFGADAVIIVGSQAILATWPDAPVMLRSSSEIDAYPVNAKDWRHGITLKHLKRYSHYSGKDLRST